MLLSNLNLVATAPGGVARLRELILTLAVQGKLVAQDASDEPASELLERIHETKRHLVAKGRLKLNKLVKPVANDEAPFDPPRGWAWSSLATIGVINPRNDAADDVEASFVQMSSIPVAFMAAHLNESRPWRDIKSGFTQFAEGDVGVAKITPCFENGKSTVFTDLNNGIGAGTTELHIVRPLCGIDARYVLLFVKTPDFLKHGEAVMTGSAGQKRMPRTYFECTPFPLPPLAEQSRIVTRVEELMRLCDALEAKGRLEAAHHKQLVTTLLGTLTDSASPEALADRWQRIAEHFDILLDRPEAVDALEQTILQLAVRGLLVPQDLGDYPASALLQTIKVTQNKLIAQGKIKQSKSLRSAECNERPFALPKGWVWTRFPDIASIAGGATPSKAILSYWTGDIPWVSPKDMKVAFISDAQDHIADAALQGSLSLIPPGSLLMVVRGMILAHSFPIARTLVPVTINQDMKALTPVDASLLPFLALICTGMKSDVLHLIDRSTHGTCKLESAKIFGMAIPLPPLAEQARIVARVEELRRLCIDLRQRLSAQQSNQSQLAGALLDSN